MSELSKHEIDALHAALDDEYKAWATYNEVINDFGSIRPFINIVESESRHINALLRVFDDYGLTPPDNPWIEKVPRFESVASACAAAVQGEIENAELYEKFIAGSEHADVRTVFENLHEASQQHHLPAFKRCMNRESARHS